MVFGGARNRSPSPSQLHCDKFKGIKGAYIELLLYTFFKEVMAITHAKAILLDQLSANANDQSWYLSFEQAVQGITEEEAFWRPDAANHSIAEITYHLIYWNKAWQIRYDKSDLHAVETLKDNADTFAVPPEHSFSDLKADLLSTLLHWQELITSEQKLDEKVPGFPVAAEWWNLIGNTTTHNAYHIGQIVYLRKMKKTLA